VVVKRPWFVNRDSWRTTVLVLVIGVRERNKNVGRFDWLDWTIRGSWVRDALDEVVAGDLAEHKALREGVHHLVTPRIRLPDMFSRSIQIRSHLHRSAFS
jgi:hypothetical protein